MTRKKNFILDTMVHNFFLNLKAGKNPSAQEHKLINKVISLQEDANDYEWIANTLYVVNEYLTINSDGIYVLKYSKRIDGEGPVENLSEIRNNIDKIRQEADINKEVAAIDAIKKAFAQHNTMLVKTGESVFSSKQEERFIKLVQEMRLENKINGDKLLNDAVISEKIPAKDINRFKEFIMNLKFVANEAAKEVEDAANAEIEHAKFSEEDPFLDDMVEKTDIDNQDTQDNFDSEIYVTGESD
jgi:hypothetical protein